MKTNIHLKIFLFVGGFLETQSRERGYDTRIMRHN
jgi:hypothetical protein